MAKNNGWLKGSWLPHRLAMLKSPAWIARSIPLIHIIDRLEMEYLQHAGTMNGQLFVSYSQFEEFGISRKSINPAIELGVNLGLLDSWLPGPKYTGNIRSPHVYRLTYLPDYQGKVPTDEWNKVTQTVADQHLASYKVAMAPRNGSGSIFKKQSPVPFKPIPGVLWKQ